MTNRELAEKIESLAECIGKWDMPEKMANDIAVLSLAVAKLSTVPDDIKAIKLSLNGNGTPEKGLVFQVTAHGKWIETAQGWVNLMLRALIFGVLGVVVALLVWETPLAVLLGKKP